MTPTNIADDTCLLTYSVKVLKRFDIVHYDRIWVAFYDCSYPQSRPGSACRRRRTSHVDESVVVRDDAGVCDRISDDARPRRARCSDSDCPAAAPDADDAADAGTVITVFSGC